MAAYKQFLTSDVIVTPFEVNKGFSFSSSEFTDNDVDIDRFEGVNNTLINNFAKTGNNNNQSKVLIYSSVKELYYSNFTSSSSGSSPVSASILPGETPAGDVLRGPSDSVGRYENYLQSTLTPFRFIPTGSGDRVFVLSLPSRLWGDYVQPNSFEYKIIDDNNVSQTITDDGNGNLYLSGVHVGNIIYPHGMAIFTNLSINTPAVPQGYGAVYYGIDVYGGSSGLGLSNLMGNVTCSFSSSYEIFETQYKATVNEFEYNFTQNPSIISGSTDGTLYDFTTGSFYQPYVTTVGLYNDAQELLAVGKLSQPYPLSRTTDTTFYINLDR